MKDQHFMKTSEYFKDIAHDHDCNPGRDNATFTFLSPDDPAPCQFYAHRTFHCRIKS